MLNIEYGSYQKLYDKYGEDFIYDPDMYFNNTYDEKWITSDIARKIIKDIDWEPLENTKENKITLITCVENEPEYRRCIQAIEKEEDRY